MIDTLHIFNKSRPDTDFDPDRRYQSLPQTEGASISVFVKFMLWNNKKLIYEVVPLFCLCLQAIKFQYSSSLEKKFSHDTKIPFVGK